MRPPARAALLLVLLLALSPAVAQHFNGGLLLGMVATQVDGDGYGGYNKAGPLGGVWVSRPMGRRTEAQMQIRYILKGSYWHRREGGMRTDYYSLNLHYTEVPLTIRYRHRPRLFFTGGLGVGYLWWAREERMGHRRDWEDVGNFRRLEYTGRLGVEYRLRGPWCVGVAFSYSLRPVRPYGVHFEWYRRGQYNRVLELYLRWQL